VKEKALQEKMNGAKRTNYVSDQSTEKIETKNGIVDAPKSVEQSS